MVVLMTILYLIHLRKTDAGIVDLGWTGGIGLLAIALALTSDGWPARRIVVACLAFIWSARLFIYLLRDRIINKSEDARYRALREYWGPKANRHFFWFFQAQSFLVILFALPLYALMQNPTPRLSAWEGVGILLWLVSISGEALSDRQLSRFRMNSSNKGKVCNTGLWKYSRHPNYFFEWLHWCAYVVMSIGAPMGWLTLLGPILMWVFLWNITGIPYTEKRALITKGEAYRKYQQSTSVFFPWYPKKST